MNYYKVNTNTVSNTYDFIISYLHLHAINSQIYFLILSVIDYNNNEFRYNMAESLSL